MPVKRTSVSTKSVDQKEYRCDYADCGMAFVRRFDFQRHQRSHCEYEDFLTPTATDVVPVNLLVPMLVAGSVRTKKEV